MKKTKGIKQLKFLRKLMSQQENKPHRIVKCSELTPNNYPIKSFIEGGFTNEI